MRALVIGSAVLAAVVAVYVATSSALNGAASGYGTPPAIYAVAFALVALGCAAALAAYRRSRAATWLFGAGAVLGVVAWPYLAASLFMAVGAVLSVVERRRRSLSS